LIVFIFIPSSIGLPGGPSAVGLGVELEYWVLFSSAVAELIARVLGSVQARLVGYLRERRSYCACEEPTLP
jgi:hypothetical protein